MSLLTLLIAIPLAAALALVFLPPNYRFVARLTALVATLIPAILAIILFFRFDADVAGYQFEQRVAWVPALGISYHVGVDGINVGLMLMGALVAFAAACVSWEIKSNEKVYYILLLAMTGGILGAFASLDLFFFYFFHELALVPTFIMIGMWGRGERRNYATFQITLYLSVGALLALVGLVALYVQAGASTFDIVELTAKFQGKPLAASVQDWIFPLLMFGFGILVSLWPFHTWAPLGYGSAPTATAMLHAGVLKKFGLYGLIRVGLVMLPQGAAHWAHLLAWLCLGNILYCGWCAMRQRDLNLLVGNSSVAHMGFAFLGIASLSVVGLTGAVLVMVAHGLLAALTFALTGYLYAHFGHLDMERIAGLLRRIPFIGTVMVMALLAGCGVPGFASFPGELLVLFSTWNGGVNWVMAAAWGGLVIGGIYMLRAIRSVLHGESGANAPAIVDANPWRRVPFVLLLAGLLLFGCVPSLLTDKIRPASEAIIQKSAAARTAAVSTQGISE